MTRTRVSTTVDSDLLEAARRLGVGSIDASLVDQALKALLVRDRSVSIDASYAAYDAHPLDESDAWGDLTSFRAAAGAVVTAIPA